MPKAHFPVLISANDLLTGDVVVLGADGRWHPDPARADLAQDEPALAALTEAARASLAANQVVDVTPVPVTVAADGTIQALELRDRIRLAGPTMRLDLGKQAGLHRLPSD